MTREYSRSETGHGHRGPKTGRAGNDECSDSSCTRKKKIHSLLLLKNTVNYIWYPHRLQAWLRRQAGYFKPPCSWCCACVLAHNQVLAQCALESDVATPANCCDAYTRGYPSTTGAAGRSGTYLIRPPASSTSFVVYCDMTNTSAGTGWNVIQRRTTGQPHACPAHAVSCVRDRRLRVRAAPGDAQTTLTAQTSTGAADTARDPDL
jgi:hypothetical protein